MLPPHYNQSLLVVFLCIRDTESDLDILFDLQIQMHELVDGGDLGTVDGNEIDLGESPNFVDFTIFLYTSDAEKLLELITPLLKTCPFVGKGYALLREALPRNWSGEMTGRRIQLNTL